MQAIFSISFDSKSMQTNINRQSTQQKLGFKLKSQPAQDTISFGSLPNNFGEVTKDLFRSAKPNTDNLIELRNKKGLKFVLDLTNSAEEKAEVEKQGMEYVSSESYQELCKFKNPKDGLKMLKSTAKEIKKLLKKGPGLVHCGLGVGRTGEVIAAYQHYILKLPDEEILKHAGQYGSESNIESVLQLMKL